MFSRLKITSNLILSFILFTGVMAAAIYFYIGSANTNVKFARSGTDSEVTSLYRTVDRINYLSSFFDQVGPLSAEEKSIITAQIKILEHRKNFEVNPSLEKLTDTLHEYQDNLSDLLIFAETIANDMPVADTAIANETIRTAIKLAEDSSVEINNLLLSQVKIYNNEKIQNSILLGTGFIISLLVFSLVIFGAKRSLSKIDETERKSQLKIQNFINLAKSGNFDERLNLNEFDGSYKEFASNMNDLMEAIVQPLNICIESLKRISGGDLTVNMNTAAEGNFGDVKNSFNRAVNNLRDIIAKVTNAAHSIAHMASEVTSTTTKLSAITEHNIINIESSAPEKNITNIAVIRAVENTCKKISDIINEIERNSFQTGILAFNTSIEAAKAGKSEKEFNSIANEIRGLADSNSEASSKIKTIIADNNGKIRDINVNSTSESAAASETPASINSLVEFIENTVHQNIISVAKLSQQVSEMIEEVKIFKTGENPVQNKWQAANQNVRPINIKVNASAVTSKNGWEEY